MNSRERVQTALNHQEPDQIPPDVEVAPTPPENGHGSPFC